jgi:branched-chain amino acid transport system substrate-binding protein
MTKPLIIAIIILGLFFGPAAAADKIKIGYVATLSGPAGILGGDILNGFKLGLKHLDEKIGGLPVELLVEDDGLDPEIGRRKAMQMVEKEGVDFLTGMVFSNVLLALVKPVTDTGTFLISANAGPSELAGAGCLPNFFMVSCQNDQPYEAMGKAIRDRGVKRLYLMAPDYPVGREGLAAVKRHFNGEIVGEVYTVFDQTDYTGELARLRDAKPDGVFALYPGGMGIHFVKQYAETGLKADIPLYTTAFMTPQMILPAMEDAGVGILHTGIWGPDLDNPVNRKFVADFKTEYERPPSFFAAQGYDVARLIDSAVSSVNGDLSDKDALRKALRAAKFQSVRGNFRFNPNHFPIQDFYVRKVTKIEDGVYTTRIERTVLENHGDAYGSKCPMKW